MVRDLPHPATCAFQHVGCLGRRLRERPLCPPQRTVHGTCTRTHSLRGREEGERGATGARMRRQIPLSSLRLLQTWHRAFLRTHQPRHSQNRAIHAHACDLPRTQGYLSESNRETHVQMARTIYLCMFVVEVPREKTSENGRSLIRCIIFLPLLASSMAAPECPPAPRQPVQCHVPR